MKIIVTGGFGFIGSYVVEEAVQRGHDVLVIDRLTYAGRTRNLSLATHSAIAWVCEDICSPLAMEDTFGGFQPEAVIHLAAETHVTRSIVCRDEFLRTNVSGTHTLLEAAVRNGMPHFVHVSTDEVYGTLAPGEPPWTELSPYRPNNPYAASKAASDHLVRSYDRTFGLSTAVCHAANNFGPRQHPEKVIPTFIRQALAGRPLTLHGDGRHSRDWLHAADHAYSLVEVAEQRCRGVFNFPGTLELSNLELAQLVLANTHGDINKIEFVPDRPGNDRRYAMAPSPFPARAVRTPLVAMEEIVDWHIANPDYESHYGR